MSNLMLCLICLIGLLFARRNRNCLAPLLGFVSTILLSAIGILGPSIWDWSRKFASPGLLPSHFLDDSQTNLFQWVFVYASFGSLLGGLVTLNLVNSELLYSLKRESLQLRLSTVKDAPIVPLVGSLTIFLLWIGLGNSIFRTTSYLEVSGSVTILRATSAILPAILTLLAFSCSNSKYRILNRIILTTIFLVMLGKGSRIVVFIPLIFLVINFSNIRGFTRRFFSVITLFFISQFLMAITFEARIGATGIANLPAMVSRAGNGLSGLQHNVESMGRMLASLTSWVPTLVASVDTISLKVVLQNLNPLIGSGTEALAYSSEGIERLFPYSWVPLSSLGQLYGLVGPIGIILVLAFVTLIAAFSLIELRTERNESIFMILAVGTFVFQFPLLFQYSTRIWFRVIWLLLLLTCAHLSIAILGKPKSERRTS